MTLAVGIQMDPIANIDIQGDSTFALALEGQRRGHRLWYYPPHNLVFADGRVEARAWPLEVRRQAGNHYTLGEPEVLDLGTLDSVLMRQDPPFDMAYITATHILEHIHPRTLVVNDPFHVRNAPEKLFVAHFGDLMPPTVITSDRQRILEARAAWGDIIVKPLFGNGGSSIFRITPDDENLNALLETFTQLYREPLIVQKYLPEIREGDRRIILVDGEAAGIINRIPPQGEARSNLHVGGRAEAATLDARDRHICDAVGPALKARGLVFAGIDVIGPYLTEINVTSPTGLQEIDRFDGANLEGLIWDAIERRLAG